MGRITPTRKHKAWEIYKTIGVYAWRRGTEWLYVGMSASVYSRINNHDVIGKAEGVQFEDQFFVYECDNFDEAADLEIELIRKFRPKYNIVHCRPHPKVQVILESAQ